jgi:hypothetical protein
MLTCADGSVHGPSYCVDPRSRRLCQGRLSVTTAAIGLGFVLAGCSSAGLFHAPEQTPPPATLTPVERTVSERNDQFRALSGNDKLARLAAIGIRVIDQSLGDESADDTITFGCPSQFPVAAVDDGWYFLPGDEVYSSFWIFPRLCFLTEQDALQAGYQRGAH